MLVVVVFAVFLVEKKREEKKKEKEKRDRDFIRPSAAFRSRQVSSPRAMVFSQSEAV